MRRLLLGAALAIVPAFTLLAQNAAPPGSPPPATSPPAASPGTGAPSAPPTTGPQWEKRDVADLDALDKISAKMTTLQVPVGATVHYESLSITVRSCQVRPANLAPDAAAFVQITDSHPNAPGFSGWLLEDEPALSMFQHPVYDVKLADCRDG
jgi:hypothetical protein